MALSVACKDAGFDCDFVVRAETMDEILAQAAQHGKEVHGFTDEQLQSPEMAEQIKSVVKQV